MGNVRKEKIRKIGPEQDEENALSFCFIFNA